MKGFFPLLVVFLIQVLSGCVGTTEQPEDWVTDGSEFGSIIDLLPEQEERVMQAIALGYTPVYCVEDECFDVKTGQHYPHSGLVKNNYIYFVNFEE